MSYHTKTNAPIEELCGCGKTVYRIFMHFGDEVLVNQGRKEIAYKIKEGIWSSQSGFELHQCPAIAKATATQVTR